MKIEVNPQDTTRAEAFDLWMTSPMPMVTLTKTFDVSALVKATKKYGVKFNLQITMEYYLYLNPWKMDSICLR